MLLSPYSGSLLRLALTTVAILALLAVAFVWWQNYAGTGHHLPVNFSLPAVSAR